VCVNPGVVRAFSNAFLGRDGRHCCGCHIRCCACKPTEKQQQREAEKAQAEAEKQQQREAEKAQALLLPIGVGRFGGSPCAATGKASVRPASAIALVASDNKFARVIAIPTRRMQN
jgi:hypothetical protein